MTDTTDNTIARVETGLTPQDFAGIREQIAKLEKAMATAGDAAKAPAAAVTATVTAQPARKSRRKGSNMTTLQPGATAPTASGIPAPNAPTFQSLVEAATALGVDAGKGIDVQVKFDMKVAEAAYMGALDIAPNKHADGVDDAQRLAEVYSRARGTTVVFDAKAGNQRKLSSNLRKMIRLGMSPKYGMGQPLQNLNDLLNYRQSLRKDPVQSKKLDDAHNMLMRYATQQLKRDTLITGQELQSFAFRRDPAVRSAEDVIESIRKLALNLKQGKISNCPDADTSPEINAIVASATKRLSAIAKARGGATP